jgi:HAD superfamily hydrolase (TIGR01493 family)
MTERKLTPAEAWNHIRCIAFDCFGTVFDMSGIGKHEIKAYVEHVKKNDFSPFPFPDSWWNLTAHPDAKEGIRLLQLQGLTCVTLSNGSRELLSTVSLKNGINWDHIIDLAKYKVYKPHEAAYATVLAETTYYPRETLMVTANPTFGDIEGAAAIGMPSQVIRHGHPNTVIELAEMLLKAKGEA